MSPENIGGIPIAQVVGMQPTNAQTDMPISAALGDLERGFPRHRLDHQSALHPDHLREYQGLL